MRYGRRFVLTGCSLGRGVPFRRRSRLGRVQYRKLGATGLDVSRLGLGGLSSGEPADGTAVLTGAWR